MVPLRPRLVLILLALLATGPRAAAAPEDAVLSAWFSAQARLETWTAVFTQTRYLKALARPLTNTGRVWFASPDRFRWELGDPVRSVAVRDGDTMLLLNPRLRRAEVHRLSAVPAGPLREALALLDTGFPRDPEVFRERFEVQGMDAGADGVTLRMVPRDAGARRFLPALAVTFDPESHDLRATEFTLADGSRVRTDFRGSVRDGEVDPVRFDTSVPEGFRVVETGGTP